MVLMTQNPFMKKFWTGLFFLGFSLQLRAFPGQAHPRILVFSKTIFYYHQSIPSGIAAIQKLGAANGFGVDTTTDASLFTPGNLSNYAAVVFLSTSDTSGTLLDGAERKALKQFIESGKGYVGIHAAADAEYHWPWYNGLVGAYFKDHPAQQDAVLHVVDTGFIATRQLPLTWKRFDEWYNFKSTRWDKVHVLITIDENSYKGGENGQNHPMSWYHSYDGGRSFYSEFGHTNETFSDPVYLRYLLGGIQYAIGSAH